MVELAKEADNNAPQFSKMAKLFDLGLTPGADVLVFKNDAPSPLILSVKDDSRLAIGRGMAHKILVSDKCLS